MLYFVLFTSPAKMSEQIVLYSEQERIPEECIVPVFLRRGWGAPDLLEGTKGQEKKPPRKDHKTRLPDRK